MEITSIAGKLNKRGRQTMTTVKAFAAHDAGGVFAPYSYDLPQIKDDEVDIAVEYCGLCHSDYSMWRNEWGRTEYPFVGGH